MCNSGFYGKNCESAYTCGSHCAPGTCTTTNKCSACVSGYFGANCDSAYTCGANCVAGSCVGNGVCNTCKAGWTGTNCATAVVCGIRCDQGTCTGPNACTKCLSGYYNPSSNCNSAYICSAQCKSQSACKSNGVCQACNQGYGVVAGVCKPVNSCLTNNGGCGARSTCTSTGPGTNSCKCFPNWASGAIPPNGKQCYAINLCLNNNGGCGNPVKNICHYVSPGAVKCTCAPPYTSPTGKNCM